MGWRSRICIHEVGKKPSSEIQTQADSGAAPISACGTLAARARWIAARRLMGGSANAVFTPAPRKEAATTSCTTTTTVTTSMKTTTSTIATTMAERAARKIVAIFVVSTALTIVMFQTRLHHAAHVGRECRRLHDHASFVLRGCPWPSQLVEVVDVKLIGLGTCEYKCSLNGAEEGFTILANGESRVWGKVHVERTDIMEKGAELADASLLPWIDHRWLRRVSCRVGFFGTSQETAQKRAITAILLEEIRFRRIPFADDGWP